MQKEIKVDKTKNNLETESLSDIENEILSNKIINKNGKAEELNLPESQAANISKKLAEKNSFVENSKKENNNINNKSLLSTKRIRNESTEEKDLNEQSKKINLSANNQINNNNTEINSKDKEIKNTNTHSNSIVNTQPKEKLTEPQIVTALGIECPYLGTIKRHLLDFDFEKVCSISLSNLNIYACLVCGKYYQGRGRNTHAYVHSLQEDHHLFINLNDEKIICLPEGYEVIDNSLKDIKLNLKPVYSEKEIAEIDKERDSDSIYSSALDGTEYIPGCIGLNNIKKTDYVNVIIQALCRVGTLRDYCLKYDDNTANLVFVFYLFIFLIFKFFILDA